jgi:hypothetical protein
VATIVAGFKTVGRAVRSEVKPSVDRMLLWVLGVSLASHCAAFISVSYFDQIQVFWFWLLAVIAAVPVWAHPELEEESLQDAGENIDDSDSMASAVLN